MKLRTDANQAAIIRDLRAIGASVQDLSKVGRGCPDILVGWRGNCYLLEIKTAKGKLNALQVEWHESWRGQVAVVRDAREAMRVIGVKL